MRVLFFNVLTSTILNIINLFLAVLHFHCCTQAFSSCSLQASCCSGFSCHGAWALGQMGFCSCGTEPLLQSRWNLPGPCCLHWQVDSEPLDHQGGSHQHFKEKKVSYVWNPPLISTSLRVKTQASLRPTGLTQPAPSPPCPHALPLSSSLCPCFLISSSLLSFKMMTVCSSCANQRNRLETGE